MSESELNLQLPADPPVQSTSTSAGDATVVALAHSVSGRVSGKAWKVPKTATVYAPVSNPLCLDVLINCRIDGHICPKV